MMDNDPQGKIIQTLFENIRKERRYRYIRFAGGLVVFAVVIMLSAGKSLFFGDENTNGFGTETYRTYEPSKIAQGKGADATIAIIKLNGVIDESLSANGFSEKSVNAILKKIKKDNSVQYVVLEIQSPGGGALETDRIFRAIKKMVGEKKVPIVSYIDGIAASGGYYLALSGEEIYAYPYSIVGNIGVIMQLSNFQHLADKLGYRMQTFKSGKFKDMGNPFREMTQEEINLFQSYVNEIYQRFTDVVKTSRGERLKKINMPIAIDGRIFTASQAETIGLIDKIAPFEEIMRSITDELQMLKGFGKVTAVRYYPARPSQFATLFATIHYFAIRYFNTLPNGESTFAVPRAYYRCC